MKILVHDYGGYPFIYELSRSLAGRGLKIIHIYSSSSGSPSSDFYESDYLTVIDLGKSLEKVKKDSLISRFWQERSYGKRIEKKIRELDPDIVISANTPLEAQKRVAAICFRKHIYFVHWLQDILSIAAENVIRKRNFFLSRIVGEYFRNIERKCLLSADYVITISVDFSSIIQKWGISTEKISIIENWANIADISLCNKSNVFSRENRIENTFNIVYSGTLGMKQDPELLVKVASTYRANPQIRIVVVATGSGVVYLKERVKTEGLTNILILPLQPFKAISEVLGSGDLLLAMLEPDASVYCVPSKVLTYYCAGKPSLLILSKENLAARLTIENKLGFVVEPGHFTQLRSVIDYALLNSEELDMYGRRARKYAEAHFGIEGITDKFLQIINMLRK